jgi:DNA-binding HxlR family transcriptional regulator
MGEICEQASVELVWAFSLLGKRWTGVIIAVLMNGPAHFADLHRAVPGISERMLSDRLTELGAAGLVSREVDEGPPLRVRYRLTDIGLALRPVLQELVTWVHENYGPEPGLAPAASRADGSLPETC